MTELVKKFEIKEILPCFTTPGYIRFTAEADQKFDEVIPVIFLKFPPGKANYSANENKLTLRIWNRLVTFHPSGKVAVTNTKDKKEAEAVLERLRNIINEAYEDYLKYGRPSQRDINIAKKVSWTDIYASLPKINCGKCGFQVCSAFALAALQGKAKLAQCTPLKEPEYSSNLKEIERKLGPFLLHALGWE